MSVMTEVFCELDDLPDRTGPEVPEALEPAEQVPAAEIGLSEGISAKIRTEALIAAEEETEFGALADKDAHTSKIVAENDDRDLLGEEPADRMGADVDNARTQVNEALPEPDIEATTDGGDSGGPKNPKPPTGGGEGEDDTPGDDEPGQEDTEEDLQWAHKHASELALLEQMLQAQRSRRDPDTTSIEANDESAPGSASHAEEVEATEDANTDNDSDADDDFDDAEEPETKADIERPAWVETRSFKEIEALRDPKQYSNEDLAVLWTNGDPEAAGALLTRNSGFFHMVTLRNLRTDEHRDLDDVKQQLELLFLKTLKRFDPEKGVKALSFAGTIAETELTDGREPSRDSVGAQPVVRQIERRIFALDRLLEQSGGHETLTEAQLARFKLDDDQLAAVRRAEERVRVHGYSPLTNNEVRSIFHNPEADTGGGRSISESKLRAVRQHTALTGKLLSLDFTGPEYSAWLGDSNGRLSDDETTSHARPVLEVPQESVDELVAEKVTNEGLRRVLPRALETLDQREREILYLRTVEGLGLENAAQRYSETGDQLSKERVRQIHAGIVDSTRYGSARGSLFRHMIANAAGYDEPRRLHGPSTESVLQARQALSDALPHLDEQSRSILNGYFILDGRDTTGGQTAQELAQQHGLRYSDVNRTINQFVTTVAGELDVGQMRQFMLDFAPIRHPLSDDERRKWGIAS